MRIEINRIKQNNINAFKPFSYLMILPNDPAVADFWTNVYFHWVPDVRSVHNKGSSGTAGWAAKGDRHELELKPYFDIISDAIAQSYKVEIRFKPEVILPAGTYVVAMGDVFPTLVRITAEAGPADNVIGRSVVEYIQWIDTNRSNYINAQDGEIRGIEP
jgi:hypothetical protein